MENQLDIFAREKATPNKQDGADIIECSFNEKKVDKSEAWDVFVDGAARGNPGPGGCGIYIQRCGDHDPLVKKGFYLGEKTNNQAEYLALLIAVFLAKKKQKELKVKNLVLTIHSDSELMVRQMCGFYKVKNIALQHIKYAIESLLSNLPHKFVHIMREKNKIADTLANLGVDKKVQISKDFFEFIADFKDVVEIIKS